MSHNVVLNAFVIPLLMFVRSQDMSSYLNETKLVAWVRRFSHWQDFQFNIFTCCCHTVPVSSVNTPWHALIQYRKHVLPLRLMSCVTQLANFSPARKDIWVQTVEKESRTRTCNVYMLVDSRKQWCLFLFFMLSLHHWIIFQSLTNSSWRSYIHKTIKTS